MGGGVSRCGKAHSPILGMWLVIIRSMAPELLAPGTDPLYRWVLFGLQTVLRITKSFPTVDIRRFHIVNSTSVFCWEIEQPQADFDEGPQPLGLRGPVLWPITWPRASIHSSTSPGSNLGQLPISSREILSLRRCVAGSQGYGVPMEDLVPNMGVINPPTELRFSHHSICPSIRPSLDPSVHPFSSIMWMCILWYMLLCSPDVRVSRDTQRENAKAQNVRVGEGSARHVLSGS